MKKAYEAPDLEVISFEVMEELSTGDVQSGFTDGDGLPPEWN